MPKYLEVHSDEGTQRFGAAPTGQLTADELNHFTGTGVWYRHSLAPGITYTEGVKYMADRAGAYWLVDKIAITNRYAAETLREQPFQVWKLRRDGSGANLTVEDGNENEVYRERIDFTDFPLPEIDVWFTDNVILLPSEY